MTQSLITLREAKGNFFDRQRVQNAVGKETAGAMARIGGYTKTTMQRSIKPARRMKPSEMSPEMAEWYKANPQFERPFKSSEPGEAPRGRTKKLKRSILFAFDPLSKSAVVGPTLFPGSRSGHAPRVLEEGGESTITLTTPNRKKKRKSESTAAQREGLARAKAAGTLKSKSSDTITVKVPVKIAPRPYVVPALNLVRPRITPEFRNLIR